jgi:hypothetical protein
MAQRLKLGQNPAGLTFIYNVSQKVGYKQSNLPEDVQLVQFLLREISRGRPDLHLLGLPNVTGRFDSVTGFYVYLWQHYAHRPVIDGVVSPAHGLTYTASAAWVIVDLNASYRNLSKQGFETLHTNPELSPALRASIQP